MTLLGAPMQVRAYSTIAAGTGNRPAPQSPPCPPPRQHGESARKLLPCEHEQAIEDTIDRCVVDNGLAWTCPARGGVEATAAEAAILVAALYHTASARRQLDDCFMCREAMCLFDRRDSLRLLACYFILCSLDCGAQPMAHWVRPHPSGPRQAPNPWSAFVLLACAVVRWLQGAGAARRDTCRMVSRTPFAASIGPRNVYW